MRPTGLQLQWAIMRAVVAAGSAFFGALAATSDAQILASTTGVAAFGVLAMEFGVTVSNNQRHRHE